MSPFWHAVRQLVLTSLRARNGPTRTGEPAPHFPPYMDFGGLVA